MPGIEIRITGAAFENSAVSFRPPVSENLEYWNFFGSTAALVKNLAAGKAKSTVVGSPVVADGYATLIGGTSHIVTGVPETADETLIIVAKFPPQTAGVNAVAISNYGGAGRSSIYYAQGSDRVVGTGGFSTGNRTLNLSTDETAWAMYVLRLASGQSRVEDVTRGISASDNAAGARAVGPNAHCLGVFPGGVVGSTGGIVHLAHASVYSKRLTDAEVAATRLCLQAVLAPKGISI